jgi:hypothetical protein
VYLASDVPAQSVTAWWLGAALPAGFHLLRVTPVDPRCMSSAQLDECAADLAGRGVTDDGSTNAGTARFFCRAPYRLTLAQPGEQLMLDLGSAGSASGGGPCP